MIVYNYDADLEVSDTCVRSSLLSWVELSCHCVGVTWRRSAIRRWPVMAARRTTRVCVVGAGVIGLSTAYRLQDASLDVDVTIVSEEFSPNTTGDGSAGFWRPFLLSGVPDELVRYVVRTLHSQLSRSWNSKLDSPQFRFMWWKWQTLMVHCHSPYIRFLLTFC